MERPERPSRHSKSHDKWKRIIHPAVDSDSSSDWSTDSNEGSSPMNAARGKRPWYPAGSQPGPSSTSAEYKQPIGDSVSEKMQRLRSLYSPHVQDYSSFVSRYANSSKRGAGGGGGDAGGEAAGTSLNYHLLHHDYAERDSYRSPPSSESTAWFLRPSDRKRARMFSNSASTANPSAAADGGDEETAAARDDIASVASSDLLYPLASGSRPAAPLPAASESAPETGEPRQEEESGHSRRHLHDHGSRYLDSRIYTWKRLTNKIFAPLSAARITEEAPDVQVISMAGPSTSAAAPAQRQPLRPLKKDSVTHEEVIILEDAAHSAEGAQTGTATVDQLPAVSTAKQDEESLNQNLIGLLECPVCMEYMSPPIHQCRRGHLVCVNCKPKLPLCPTCRSRLTDSRNLAMEKVADKLLYPCKNANDGCQEHLRLKDKGDHEANCDYRTYRCSLPLCDWKGLRDELLPHYTSHHKDDLLFGEEQELLLQLGDLSSTTNQNWIVSAHNELFRVNFITMTTTPRMQLFETGTSRMQIFGCAQYIGPQCRSALFAYTLKMQQRDGKQRCVYFSRATHTDLVNCATNYATGDSFYMRGDTAELLGQGGIGNLVLKVQLTLQPNAK